MEDGRWSTPHVGSVGRGQVDRVAPFSGIFDGRWYFQVVNLKGKQVKYNIYSSSSDTRFSSWRGKGAGH